jgi:hypothetical protein
VLLASFLPFPTKIVFEFIAEEGLARAGTRRSFSVIL